MNILLRIGEAATRAGVSPRTLRYYQELGLLSPAEVTPGGARRYTEGDVERVRRIRDLQDLMGFDLGEIAAVLTAEDALARLRAEYYTTLPRERREALLQEATAINRDLQEQVRRKRQGLDKFLEELEGKARRYRELAEELATHPDASAS